MASKIPSCAPDCGCLALHQMCFNSLNDARIWIGRNAIGCLASFTPLLPSILGILQPETPLVA